jgi:hypothetical protein
VLDQTAESDPGDAVTGRSEVDDDEPSLDLDGIEATSDPFDDPFHVEEPAPEVDAMHLEETTL